MFRVTKHFSRARASARSRYRSHLVVLLFILFILPGLTGLQSGGNSVYNFSTMTDPDY